MFGLTLACAFAASTPTVVAKMPTLAIAIRARFMIYLPFEISSAEGNACVKANVPNDYRVVRRARQKLPLAAMARGPGLGNPHHTGGSASGTHYARQRFLTGGGNRANKEPSLHSVVG